jgi:immunoglobulin I-set domain protein
LTVTAGPVITVNPTNQALNAGQTATFTAAATGTPTPTVQWQVSTDGGSTFNPVAGATTTTLSFTTTAGQNGNKYRAVFTNTSGSATTSAATLTVNFAPTITTNPVNQSVTTGSTANFTAAANGNPAPTVQWQVSIDGGATFNNVAGAITTTLSFTTSAGQNGNQYRAVFTNSVGSATTTAATLTVTGSPIVTLNPANQSVSAGATATFTAAATGTPTPTVQWQVSIDGGSTFGNVAGATTTTLSFIANGAMNGNLYRAVFSNTGGSATTTAALLTVGKLTPVITWSNPADISFGGALGSAQLNASANVAGTFIYTPPAGTVLPLGPSMLSVVFTPTDTADYTTASKTVTINVDPISGGGTPANLVVTYVLTRDPSTQNVVVAITVANSGGTDAGSVQINAATIGGTSTTASLPIMLGTVAAGGQGATTVQFPGTVGTTGSRAVLSIAGGSTAGAFGANGRVVLP